MKKLILVKTKFGSTLKYAEWLNEDIQDSTLIKLEDFDPGEIENYDLIIVCSKTYMGSIKAAKFMQENWGSLSTKKVYLLVVGIIPAESNESKESYNQIPEEIRNSLIGYKKLPGAIKREDLNFFEKIIMYLRKGKDSDKVKRENLDPVINDLKSNYLVV